jgi:hypothetical protein
MGCGEGCGKNEKNNTKNHRNHPAKVKTVEKQLLPGRLARRCQSSEHWLYCNVIFFRRSSPCKKASRVEAHSLHGQILLSENS